MGDIKRYTESCMEGGGVAESKDGELVDYSAFAETLSQLAALREELAEVSGTLEFNTTCWGRERVTMIDKNQDLQQRLADAERRNAEDRAALQLATKLLGESKAALNPTGRLAKDIRDLLDSIQNPKIFAALNKPEEAKS